MPLLKKPDEISSQINFLTEIYHLKNIKTINTDNVELCELIKNFLINELDLNKSSLDKIGENLLSSEEKISISNLNKNIKYSNFGCLLIGPTGAGKSSLLKFIIKRTKF